MVQTECPQWQASSCFLSLLTSDELLQKCWEVENLPNKQAEQDPNTPNKQLRLACETVAVSQALNQLVNCLPGLTKIDQAIKSIAQPSLALQG